MRTIGNKRTIDVRMDNQRHFIPRLREPGHIATITVIGVAYAIAVVGYWSNVDSPSGPPFSAGALFLSMVLGAVYLWLFLDGGRTLSQIFGQHATTALFVLTLSLMVAIQFLLHGYGAIWLIGMPLVATTVTELPSRWRWPVYLIVVAGMSLPIYLSSGDWRGTLFAMLTYCTAIVFVVVFVQVTQQAELAQQRSAALAKELETANRQLTAYAVQAEELATTQERNRLAREIHDNLGHYLTVVNVQIKAALAVMDKDPDRARQSLDKAQLLTQEGLQAVRQSVSALRESPLGGRSLPHAIDDLAMEMQSSGVMCTADVAGLPRPLDPRQNLTLYRTAQEALTNARKHARAARVDVNLDYSDPGRVTLRVSDDGIGADGIESDHRFGLLGLRERVRQLGGTLSIETALGKGFTLTVSLPSILANGAAETVTAVSDTEPAAMGGGGQ